MCRTSVIGVSDTAIRPILEVSVLHKVKVFELMVFNGRFYFSGRKDYGRSFPEFNVSGHRSLQQ